MVSYKSLKLPWDHQYTISYLRLYLTLRIFIICINYYSISFTSLWNSIFFWYIASQLDPQANVLVIFLLFKAVFAVWNFLSLPSDNKSNNTNTVDAWLWRIFCLPFLDCNPTSVSFLSEASQPFLGCFLCFSIILPAAALCLHCYGCAISQYWQTNHCWLTWNASLPTCQCGNVATESRFLTPVCCNRLNQYCVIHLYAIVLHCSFNNQKKTIYLFSQQPVLLRVFPHWYFEFL